MASPTRPGGIPSPEARASPHSAQSGAVEGAAPGTSALFRGLAEDRSHAVLDLGAATDQSLRVYGRFARWIHFADLLGEPWSHQPSAGGLQLPRLDRTYDLVFAWDILDRLYAEARSRLVQWLSEIAAPGARLHVIVRGSEEEIARPLRFTLLDVGRIRCEPAGTTRLTFPKLLPAEVAKVLSPWQVAHAFTLKTGGLREYVAVRP